MEFQAYPESLPTGRKDIRALLRIQNVFHSTDSVILPMTLLILCSFLPAYQHMNEQGSAYRNSVKHFLLKILVSMMPLATLECKIFKCADPIGLFSRFSTKVMLMHFFFLAVRMSSLLFDGVDLHYMNANAIMFLASAVLLPTVFGLRPTLAGLKEHADTCLLALACFAVAYAEVWTFSSKFRRRYFYRSGQVLTDVLMTGSDYIELMAFLPAVWMAYRRAGQAGEAGEQHVSVTQKRAVCLFAFMMAFYTVEDIAHAVDARRAFPIATVAHIIHYLLVLDFAGFLLAHLYDPEKLNMLKGSFVNWVADLCGV